MNEQANPKALLQPDYSNPERYRRLSSGAIQDLQTGRIVSMDSTQNPHAITTQNARGMLARREEKSRQQARDAVDTAAIKAGRLSPELSGTGLGWLALVEKAAELVFEAKSGRGAEGVLTFLARATGNLENGKDEGGAGNPGSGSSPHILLLIAEMARRRDIGEVIDATEPQ